MCRAHGDVVTLVAMQKEALLGRVRVRVRVGVGVRVRVRVRVKVRDRLHVQGPR